MKIKLQLYGAFSQLAESLEISLSEKSSITELREAFKQVISKLNPEAHLDNLIDSSRFANDFEILPESTKLADGDQLAILPPVSGG